MGIPIIYVDSQKGNVIGMDLPLDDSTRAERIARHHKGEVIEIITFEFPEGFDFKDDFDYDDYRIATNYKVIDINVDESKYFSEDEIRVTVERV